MTKFLTAIGGNKLNDAVKKAVDCNIFYTEIDSEKIGILGITKEYGERLLKEFNDNDSRLALAIIDTVKEFAAGRMAAQQIDLVGAMMYRLITSEAKNVIDNKYRHGRQHQ